jgi:hypothetical protein
MSGRGEGGDYWGSSEGSSDPRREGSPGGVSDQRNPERPINNEPDYWGSSEGSSDPHRAPTPQRG